MISEKTSTDLSLLFLGLIGLTISLFLDATMILQALYSFILLVLYIFPRTQAEALSPPAYNATDLILLSCGELTNSSDTSHRSWGGDVNSSYALSIGASSSSASNASYMNPFVFPVPYRTARVFHSPFTYTFPLSPGCKFLRLHFYPDVYSGFNTSESFFSVTANSFALLSNFSAFLYSQNSSQPSFVKEFVINIEDSNDKLLLYFLPEGSFAFVNGIEIISIPDKLYFRGKDFAIKYPEVNTQLFYLDNNTSFENLYRLNVGGSRIEIQDDSGPTRGMFRAWSPDDDYLTPAAVGNSTSVDNFELKYTIQTPPFTAPYKVYTTARVTANSTMLDWEFMIDSGFFYLLRLHLCEFTPGVTKPGKRMFTIAINNFTAESQADIVLFAGDDQTAIFKDYVTFVPDDGRRGKQFLRLSLYPNSEGDPKYRNALLSGLEIFKLNDSNGSLAAANPELPIVKSYEEKKKAGSSSVFKAAAAIGIVIGVVTVVGVLSILIFQRKHKVKKPSYYSSAANSSWLPLSSNSRSITSGGSSAASQPCMLCTHYPLDQIKAATCNFNSSFIIGKGGFGYVYKGQVDNCATTVSVAIKRLNPSSNQGAHEFLTEIQMLSKLRHLHLVSLIGYCNEDGEMILVYDYMAHGSLRDHLYNSDNSPLSWKQRLQISMGAAKGLHYLHTGAEHAIIHRDVKSTNILLDENWVAKISDFGLSRMGDANDSFTHISTNVKGTFGYLDPKYLSTNQLTRKSDVYAFGVVLFEVLSGRPAVDVRLDEEQHSLAGWARHCVREGEVDRLIDPNLTGKISRACLETFVGIARRCIHIQPLERPTMADVVMGLELSLALQETTDTVQLVDEGDDAGIIYGDRSEIFISMDEITDSKGELDRIMSQENPSSSNRKIECD